MVSLVTNGEQVFLDINGDPLAAGKVYFYEPGTTTPKTTWHDPGQAAGNPNPVILDQAGRAVIWGEGRYRQVVQDQFGVAQWDVETDTGGGGGVIVGDQTIQGNQTINGNQTVTGISTLGTVNAATVNVAGGLNVTGASTFQGPATFEGGINTQGGIATLGDTNVIGTLTGNVVTSNGGRLISRGFSSPSVTCFNQADNVAMGMWEASDRLHFGVLDGNGNPLTDLMIIDQSGVLHEGHVLPNADNTYICGGASQAWQVVEAYSFVTSTSSVTVKEDIEPLKAEQCLGVVRDLRPVSFQYKKSDGVHSGFIAEEVLKAIEGSGLKSGAVIKRDVMGLAYNELVPVLWGAVRENLQEISDLKSALEELRTQVAALKQPPAPQ